MAYKVASFYRFLALPDFRDLQDPLRRICAELQLMGTILLAREGINGTIAGSQAAIEGFLDRLRRERVFANRFDALEIKVSAAVAMPFGRLKVRLKKEIVTLGHRDTDPTQRVGTYVDAADWNALIEAPDILLIDARNHFEVALGTFAGASDPKLERFGAFQDYVAANLDPKQHKRIALFCTGGIRCEKASSYLLARGFDEVYHLKGGILRYLEVIPEAQSRWTGACFVFDDRVALGHGLVQCTATGDLAGAPMDAVPDGRGLPVSAAKGGRTDG